MKEYSCFSYMWSHRPRFLTGFLFWWHHRNETPEEREARIAEAKLRIREAYEEFRKDCEHIPQSRAFMEAWQDMEEAMDEVLWENTE